MISAAQKIFRRNKLGSSDAAAALGLNPFESKATIYHILLGNIERADPGEKGIIGNEIEPVIANSYERRTGIKLFTDHTSYIHPKYPWMVCHLDRHAPELVDARIVELKNVGPFVAHHWGEDGDPEGPPRYTLAQVVEQAIVVSANRAVPVNRVDVAAMFGGGEMRIYPVEITQEAKDAVETGLVSFWNDHIVPRKQPEVTSQDLELLKKLYWNPDNGEVVQVSGKATAEAFQHYRQIKAQIKELKEQADAYKASIQDHMKNAAILMRSDDIEYKWTRNKDRRVINWEQVARRQAKVIKTIKPKVSFISDKIIDTETSVKRGNRVFRDLGADR